MQVEQHVSFPNGNKDTEVKAINAITNACLSPPSALSDDNQTSVTGKRVRKKNPRYSDEGTIPTNTPKAVLKKTKGKAKKTPGRPRKKRKTDPGPVPQAAQELPQPASPLQPHPQHVAPAMPQIVSPPVVAPVATLEEQQAELLRQMKDIQQDLRSVNAKLYEKQVEMGLPVTATHPDELQFDEPMETDQQFTPALTEVVPPVVAPAPARGRTRKVSATPRKPLAPKKKATGRRKVPEPKEPSPPLPADFSFCRDVLDQLLRHRYGLPFRVPVDPVLLGIPDYHLIIKNPMDLGTIRNKLNTNQFADVSDFVADVHLVFNNACTYNRPNSDVYIMAETLRKVFLDKIKPLAKKVNADTKDAGGFQDLKKSVDEIRDEIRHLIVQKTKIPRPAPPPEDSLPLTKEEKKKLSAGISTLSAPQLKVVIRMIQEKIPEVVGEKKEIVIDIDSLDVATLRAMLKYVQSTRKKSSSRRKGSSHDKASSHASAAPSKPAESDSESESESESESSESESESESDGEPALKKKEIQVETVIPPVLPNLPVRSPSAQGAVGSPAMSTPPTTPDVPKIIGAFPTSSEVKVDEINADSWSKLSSADDDAASTHAPSSDVTNLWSSYRDSHAQLEQKELEKKQHEEELVKAQEEEEKQRLLQLQEAEEEKKLQKTQEEERKRQQEIERKLQEERDIEEARQQAKRDRESKVQDADGRNDAGDLLSLNSFSGGTMLDSMNFSGDMMSNIRSSMGISPGSSPTHKGGPAAPQDPPGGTPPM